MSDRTAPAVTDSDVPGPGAGAAGTGPDWPGANVPVSAEAVRGLLGDVGLSDVALARRARRLLELRAAGDHARADRYGWASLALRIDGRSVADALGADPDTALSDADGPVPLPRSVPATVPATSLTTTAAPDRHGWDACGRPTRTHAHPHVARDGDESGGDGDGSGGDDSSIVGVVSALDAVTVRIEPHDHDERTDDAIDQVGPHGTVTRDAWGGVRIDVPVSTAARWLWWFATPHAGRWRFDAAAVRALHAAIDANDTAIDALALEPADQAAWPAGITPASLGVTRTLRPAQIRDIGRMVTLGGGANFSVPGAGKTTMAYVAAAILEGQGHVEQVLVVAPLSAHEAWQNEPAEVFRPENRPRVHVLPGRPGGGVNVINLEALANDTRLDRWVAWTSSARTLVVFDEAHRAKAGESGVRGRAARRLAEAAARTIVLTGTPRPNSETDLVAVLDLAYPGHGARLVASGPRVLRSAYCRVTKSELDLPALDRRTERVALSPAHDRIVDALVDRIAQRAVTDPGLFDDVTRAARAIMLLLAATTDPAAVFSPGRAAGWFGTDGPLAELDDLLRDAAAQVVPTKLVRAAELAAHATAAGNKLLVWSCFRSHVTRLETLLADHQPAVVTGGVQGTDRADALTRFRTDPGCRVLIATPQTLSEGVSLHHTTTHQLWVDRTFNAGMFLQGLDRTHRLGLAPGTPCSATYLVAERADGTDTIDMVVAARLEAKITAMGAILDDPDLAQLALPDDDTRVDAAALDGDDIRAVLATILG